MREVGGPGEARVGNGLPVGPVDIVEADNDGVVLAVHVEAVADRVRAQEPGDAPEAKDSELIVYGVWLDHAAHFQDSPLVLV